MKKTKTNHTFGNFIVSKNNKEAYNACVGLLDSPKGKLIVLYGNNSYGKTHLLHAVGNAFKERYPKLKVITVNYEDLISQYITALHKAEAENFVEELIKTDVLIMDNAQFLAGKIATQEKISKWIKRMLSARKNVVLAFDRPIKYYTNLINEIVESDSENCTMAEIKQPDYHLRKQYLKYLLNEYPVKLPFIIKEFISHSHRRVPFSSISGFIYKCSLLEKQKGLALSVFEIGKCLSCYIHKEEKK